VTHLTHLVRADARRFGVLLAVWVLLQVADTIFRGVRPALVSEMRLATTLELLGTVLVMTRWLGMVVIVALVVQTHALVGSDAFWMTRPIPWRDLLASKLVLLGTTFVGVPTLCDVGLMLALRVPVSDIPKIALQTALFHGLWLVLFMAVSAITRNLARLALVGGSLLAGLVLLLNITIAVMVRNLPDGPQLVAVSARTMPSPAGGVVMMIVLTGAAIALVMMQYRTRSVRASVATGAAGLAAMILVGVMWPWQPRQVPVPAWATADAAVKLVSESVQGQFKPLDDGHPWRSGGAWRIGSLELRAAGVEDGWLATAKLDTGTVSFGDGTTLATAGNGYSAAVRPRSVEEAPLDTIVRRVLGVARLLEASPEELSGRWTPAIVLTQADFDKYQSATGTYRGRFVVDLDRVVVAATLPLQAGAVFEGHRHRIRIDQVSAGGGTASIRLRELTSRSTFDSDTPPTVTFYLRNRAAGEAVAGLSGGTLGTSPGVGLILVGLSYPSAEGGTGFHVASSVIRFPARYGVIEKRVELSAEWLAQSELVILHTIAAGSVTRTVEVPGFQMTAAPTSPLEP
jgi:hypothetical protein